MYQEFALVPFSGPRGMGCCTARPGGPSRISTITPPVGTVLLVTARVADLPFEAVGKATMPFLLPLLAVLLAIIVWPPFTT